MLAVFTSSASTLVFHALYVSEVVELFELGVNSNSTVRSKPDDPQRVQPRGGVGLRPAAGCGGSFGGPDFAGAEK